ncbi:MAG: family 20 glycosylhydrolase [Roseivirga sp.]|nr:family 20 glycosylhydrolase [Roseivirga sp.]
MNKDTQWISRVTTKSSSIGSVSILLSTVCLLLLFTCQSPHEEEVAFRLLPQPDTFSSSGASDMGYGDIKNFSSTDGSDLPPLNGLLNGLILSSSREAQIEFRIDETLDIKPEGYTLDIEKHKINIVGKDKAGLLYGFMSLEQLMEDAKDQQVNLPLCHIEDFPQLAYRSVHLDIKHHREKTDYYYRLMDRLAKYKVNAIIAEVEDKIKYVRQPEIGADDALSIDEWKKLSDYAKARNIEISPLVQGLGHASFILKHDNYKHLRDNPESDWAFNPLDPKTYEVQFDLYRDAMEATPHGKYLHVGGDEVHTTGRGSGKSALELNLIWLNKVTQFAEEHGRIPIFWDDMPLKHAGVYRPMFDPNMSKEEVDKIWEENEPNLVEFLDHFPKNCIYMRWNYQQPGTYGNLKAMDWFTSNGFQVMGATAGQTRWVLMPQNQSNIENIKSFALSSIDKGLNGLLLTLWDDDSPHFELYMRGIMAFAEYSWAGEKRSAVEFKQAHRQRAFGHVLSGDDYAFIDKLETPVGQWKNVLLEKGVSRNNVRKMTKALIDVPDPNNKGTWASKYAEKLILAKEMLATCDSIADQITEMKQKTERNSYSLEVYEQVNELIRFSYNTLIAMEQYDLPSEVMSEEEALKNLQLIPAKFRSVKANLEKVYAKTRILEKPDGYKLDQDHHVHLANQALSFDWQFLPEIQLMEKLQKQFASRK